jgi:hypothetical protein
MRLNVIVPTGQAVVTAVLLLCSSCFLSRAGETAVTLPETPPLSRRIIGYGVISVSYTHVTAEPSQAGLSLGYFRRGSLVEVTERRSVSHGEFAESWVFVEGAYRGWLRENVVEIYDNEAKAKTAAERLIR